MEQYVMLVIMLLMTIGFSGAAAVIHGAQLAQATMRQYVQAALQQVADSGVTISPTDASQYPESQINDLSVSAAFQQDFSAVLAGTPWASRPIAVDAVGVVTPSHVGTVVSGYPGPGGVPTAPGYYAEVTFPWHVVSWLPAQPITVWVMMQSNVLEEPSTTKHSFVN